MVAHGFRIFTTCVTHAGLVGCANLCHISWVGWLLTTCRGMAMEKVVGEVCQVTEIWIHMAQPLASTTCQHDDGPQNLTLLAVMALVEFMSLAWGGIQSWGLSTGRGPWLNMQQPCTLW